MHLKFRFRMFAASFPCSIECSESYCGTR